MKTTQNSPVETLLSENELLKNENLNLKEQLAWFKRNLFGSRSEKIIPKNKDQLEFDGFGNLKEKEAEKRKVNAHTRSKSDKKGKDSITLPADLPTVTIVVDLPEDQKKMSRHRC